MLRLELALIWSLGAFGFLALSCGFPEGIPCADDAACKGIGGACSSDGVCRSEPLFLLHEVSIPAGTFSIGSPSTEASRFPNETLHTATLTRSFFMKKHEVTQGEFQTRMGYNPSFFKECGLSCPVENVSWHEAAAFCNAASRVSGLPECFDCVGSGPDVSCQAKPAYRGSDYVRCSGYRLPTETEWEVAYRAGTSAPYSDGDLGKIAWHQGNSKKQTQPVGRKKPNAWGLYDMAGNVWEWCYDWHGAYPKEGATDPGGPAAGYQRVLRGGAWLYYITNLRVAHRGFRTPTERYNDSGFRVVRSNP